MKRDVTGRGSWWLETLKVGPFMMEMPNGLYFLLILKGQSACKYYI